MGVEKSMIDTNKIKQNPGDVYRPPALRTKVNNETIKNPITVDDGKNLQKSSSKKLTNTSSSQFISHSTLSNTTTNTLSSCNSSPIRRNEDSNVNNLNTSVQETTYKTHQQYVVAEQQKELRQQQPVRRERRPDRAVYIPRARRSQTTPPNTFTSQIHSPPQQQQPGLSTQLPATAPIQSSNTSKSPSQQLAITSDNTIAVLVKHKQSAKADEVSKINIVSKNNLENSRTSTITKKKEKSSRENKDLQEQRREQELLKKISTQQKHLSMQENDVNHFCEFNDNTNLSKGINCDNCKQINVNQELLDYNVQSLSLLNSSKQEPNDSVNIENPALNNFDKSSNGDSFSSNGDIVPNIFITSNKNNINNTMPKTPNVNKTNKLSSEVENLKKTTNLRIEDVQSQQLPAKCDIEEQELQRASKEINRSNRRIIKQTFLSDVLQIPDSIVEEKSEPEPKISITSQTNTNVPTLKTQLDSNIEEEEDDWESMYNESGDCLDPKIMQELTASVGKCKIELPKMDYSAYLTKQSILNEEEFPHVLEVSNFPVEFKNQDLLMVFSQYKESGFDIKWVDDTHALAVFSSSRIAAEVLTMGHPFVVLKPLAEATMESRLKAKKCAASLQPYRPRPETCAALARRLVTGALGVRLKTAAAERENEKRVLREAKERKLLAAKQRDEAWES